MGVLRFIFEHNGVYFSRATENWHTTHQYFAISKTRIVHSRRYLCDVSLLESCTRVCFTVDDENTFELQQLPSQLQVPQYSHSSNHLMTLPHSTKNVTGLFKPW